MSSNSPEQLSRRDWFRLRIPKPNHERLGSEQNAGMQSVPEPPNHDGLDLSELPPVHEAILSLDQVHDLFSDLQQHASNVQLLARGSSTSDMQIGEYLKLACERLVAGSITKLQIRYEWQASQWIDTLEQNPSGFRIVRIKRTMS